MAVVRIKFHSNTLCLPFNHHAENPMIRNIRHSLSMLLSLAALALVPASPILAQAAETPVRMELPTPNKSGGMPLMQALNERHSTKIQWCGPCATAAQRPFVGHLGKKPRRWPQNSPHSHEQTGCTRLCGP